MQHLPAFIIDLALILGVAALTSFIFKFLKQPVVLGYLLAGLLVGPNFDLFPTVVEIEGIQVWAEIGVIFLLFALGLEFSFKKLIRMGSVAGITAVIEVFLTMFTGFFIGRLLGWEQMDCLFFGGILAIASTTIIIRSFEELGVKSQNFAGLVTGILVIEDLVAVILMVVLSTVSVSRSFEGTEMLISVFKLVFFLILWFVSGIYFLPTFLRMTRKYLTEETLLIVSLALCMLMVILAHQAGFSPALGAFIMGSVLAETNKAEKIEHVLKPLKNMFGAVFFVSVGMLINIELVIVYYVPVLLGVFVLIFAKPLYVTLGALITGQPMKTSVQAGMSLSQIGEFSFIIAALGLSLNVISEHLYPIAVAISVLTTFTTPFMIRLSEPFNGYLERRLPENWKRFLVRYGSGAQKVSEVSEWRRYIRSSILNIVVFSVIIVAIIVLGNKVLATVIQNRNWNYVLAPVITFLAIVPFLWALAFRGVKINPIRDRRWNTLQRGPLFALMIGRMALSVFFIGLLFETFYSTLFAAIGVTCSVIFAWIFRRKIRESYFRIEKRFVTNLHAKETGEQAKAITPWDSHMANFEMRAGLSIIGIPLQEARLRERFGINVAVIRRGEQVINVPNRFERLYPSDIVSVIGTDTDIERFNAFMEQEMAGLVPVDSALEVSLQHFTVSEKSPLVNKTIRECGIREQTKGLVVGIERDGQRILNPDSDFLIVANDTIWLVGDDKRIQVLARAE